MKNKNKINKVHFLPELERSTPSIKDRVLVGFMFEYNTTTETCCKNQAVMNNELLLEF